MLVLVLFALQVRFGVLNAGNFGVPQSRKRTFIWAAAPDEDLPSWPTPRHVFRCAHAAVRSHHLFSSPLGTKQYPLQPHGRLQAYSISTVTQLESAAQEAMYCMSSHHMCFPCKPLSAAALLLFRVVLLCPCRSPQLTVNLPGGVAYCAVDTSQPGAPLRTVTVRDAIGDLPPIENGHDQ